MLNSARSSVGHPPHLLRINGALFSSIMCSNKGLLYHRNHKISPTLSTDSINKQVPLRGHVMLESGWPFFQRQLEMLESMGGEEEKKGSDKFLQEILPGVLMPCDFARWRLYRSSLP